MTVEGAKIFIQLNPSASPLRNSSPRKITQTINPESQDKTQNHEKARISQESQIAKNTVSEDDEVIKEEHTTSAFLKSIYKADEEDGMV